MYLLVLIGNNKVGLVFVINKLASLGIGDAKAFDNSLFKD